MKRIIFSILVFTLVGIPRTDAPKAPFSLSVVPTRNDETKSSISMARKTPDEFFVVLTNVTQETQAIWETWNSWGYQAISFELTTSDGKKVVVSVKPQDFTVNFPSRFLIKPGEHQVFAIRLDDKWETRPSLAKKNEMPITLKAIYEVTSALEATQYKVWTGRIESHNYNLTLRQW
ncbi:MAG: hypothetical protein WAM91_07190 [Candidatus Acidiferrales bacterium]